MVEPVAAGNRPPGGSRPAGATALVVAAVAVAVIVVWLVLRRPGDVVLGYAGGPVAMLAGVLACLRIGAARALPPPVRAFWRRFAHAGIVLLIASGTSLALANNNAGMSLYVAVPTVVGILMAMSAFAHLPLGPRTRLAGARLLLDGATVAVSGILVFWYVLLQHAPPGTSPVTRAAAAVVGVTGLLALMVIGKAAVSPEGQVDPTALRILAVAPIVAVAVAVLLLVGDATSRMWLSVLAVPLVALAMTAAAYRQGRTDVPVAAHNAGRSLYGLLPYLAVLATTGLVITVSVRQNTARERGVIVGAVLIVALVAIRQLLGARDDKRLLVGIRAQQAQLERLAMTDPLTGLANRTRFVAVLAERLEHHAPAAVLLIDIDDFKMVNDTIGPAAGDRLLYEVAQRLRQNSGVCELPTRLGGDEFAVLLGVDGIEQAQDAATRVLHALTEPFRVDEHPLLVHASIGIAIAGPGDCADEVLRNADIAMYAAKESGKAAWTRFEPWMRHDVLNHARIGSELHDALVRHELHLLYQPVFDIATGEMHGAEALVRWSHPARGVVSPADFIPVAERSALIVPLGTWVLREACEQLRRWQQAYGGRAIEAINVNVAVRQLREPGFVDEVAAVLSETGLLPRNLVLEVTESSVADGRQVRETLQALHGMGVRLALDDFGTGQSSLSLLRAFPVDVLKLDKSFVDGIADGEDRGRLAVAAAVAQLTEYLQLSAVAEGIESEAQLVRLRTMGYRFGQGFYLSKPLPADEAGKLMAAEPVVPVA